MKKLMLKYLRKYIIRQLRKAKKGDQFINNVLEALGLELWDFQKDWLKFDKVSIKEVENNDVEASPNNKIATSVTNT